MVWVNMTVTDPALSVDLRRARARWAASGGMDLTGEPDGPPLAPPAPVAAVLESAGRWLGIEDPAALVGERGLTRQGSISCGGATRLLPCADGWLAVALPRPEDLNALPAWLGVDAPTRQAAWPLVAARLIHVTASEATERARLLELAVTAVGETPPAPTPWVLTRVEEGHGPGPEAPLVVDLSALWAGPLCADLLALDGARVLKVEDPRRPDGSRSTPDLFELLNGRKEHRSLRISPGGELHRLLGTADVVISSARPRACEQLGIDVGGLLRSRPTVWVAITAHGWDGDGRDRVGFGDDAAASAGLVTASADGRPGFVADAVADPLCGTLAAAAAAQCLARGGSWFVDASLARAAAYTVSFADGETVAAVSDGRGGWALPDGDDLVPVARARARALPRHRYR